MLVNDVDEDLTKVAVHKLPTEPSNHTIRIAGMEQQRFDMLLVDGKDRQDK